MNAPNKHTAFNVDAFWPAKRLRGSLRNQPADAAPAEFLVLALPGFSQLCLSSLIDPLRIANSLSGRDQFRWRLVSLDGAPVECASGLSMAVSGSFLEHQKAMALDPACAIVICAGEGVEKYGSHELRAALRRAHRARVPLYALGTATWLLAESALLNDIKCTIHWGKMAALSDSFYDLAVDDALFVRVGGIVTCAGELAAFDLAQVTMPPSRTNSASSTARS